MEIRRSRKKLNKLTWIFLAVFLLMSAYFYSLVLNTPYLGIRAAKVNNEWKIKKLQFNGSAIGTGIKIGDKIVRIDSQHPEKNQLLNQFLIVEQAESITVLSEGKERTVSFSWNSVNLQRFSIFFLVSLCGFFFLFNFIKKQISGRSGLYFYSFIILILFSLLSIVPSSIGSSLARTMVILCISLFPVYLNLFLSKTTKRKKDDYKSKIDVFLFGIAVFNVVVWVADILFDTPNFLTEYVSLGVFYNLGLCLMLILVNNMLMKSSQKVRGDSKVNLSLITILSFMPMYVFYIFPSKWTVPFSIVCLFALLPLLGVLHFLILSRLVSYRYKVSTRMFYLSLTIIISVIILLITLLSQFIPVLILFFYSCFLIYSLLPLIEEVFLIIRRKKDYASSIALFSAVEDERESISNFIHDTVIQDIIYSMKNIEENRQPISKNEALEVFDEIVFHLRELCSDIYPLMIQELGLETALLSMISQLEKRHPVIISTDLEISDLNLSAKQNNFILRSIKELMNNSILHGKATLIHLRIFKEQNYCCFQVSDNGAFILKQDDGKPHFGLGVIEEKLLLLNGHLDMNFHSETSIIIKIPSAT